MIDTHTHIYLEEFDADRSEVVQRALSSGVRHMVLPNVDLTTIEPMHRLHEQFAQCTSMAMGLHPTEVNGNFATDLKQIEHWLGINRYVAVGEVGIDLYWDKTYWREQLQVLDIQMHWARQLGLPVIIHCREGLEQVLQVIDGFTGELPVMVFHSFTGSADDVAEIRRRGDFYFGINGIVTFKKSTIPQLLPLIGLNRLLLETDSPYLAPVPNRGKRNESANIPHIAACIAAHLGIDVEQVSQATDANAHSVFGIE
ncbi:MAG: TatD family hydrolase [Muribaculaceae bacterium]